MTIRLTSAETFEKVLEKLKHEPLYNGKVNETFFKYCVDDIKEGIATGDDEWYLDVDWLPDSASCGISMVFRYHKRSGIPTDEEYLHNENNQCC